MAGDSGMGETRADHLARTSEIYRRLRAAPDEPPAAVPEPPAPPPAPVAPEVRLPPPGPSFARRLFTRRPDTRELVLLGVAIVVMLSV